MPTERKDRPPGRETPILWQGRRAKAWVPALLAARDLSLSERTVRHTEQAAAAARRSSEALPVAWEPLARLLLRAEGVASSFIEGVRASPAEVAAAEFGAISSGESASWVAQNLAAVVTAVAEAHEAPLTVESLHRWHQSLMTGSSSHLPEHLVGAFRDVQGWIGGTSPLDAAFVPPPPEEIKRLVDDLVVFANRDDIDAVTQAGIAHAQFEVIHPYGDGNGRIGRTLVAWILTRRLALTNPPPVSVNIARDRGGYLSGLTLFRMGDIDPWVRWFAITVGSAADATVSLIGQVEALQYRWAERLVHVRADAGARRLLCVLPQHPVLTSTLAASAIGVSERAARSGLNTLFLHRIVEPLPPSSTSPSPSSAGARQRRWVATELIDLVTAWSR